MHTSLTIHQVPPFENHQSRNTLHLISGSQLIILIDINFENPNPFTQFSSHFLEYRSLSLAWTTPGSVKIYNNRALLSNKC